VPKRFRKKYGYVLPEYFEIGHPCEVAVPGVEVCRLVQGRGFGKDGVWYKRALEKASVKVVQSSMVLNGALLFLTPDKKQGEDHPES
jgi:hypothetical protein